jgi:hypothetical protein
VRNVERGDDAAGRYAVCVLVQNHRHVVEIEPQLDWLDIYLGITRQ